MSAHVAVAAEILPLGEELDFDDPIVPESIMPGGVQYAELLNPYYLSMYGLHHAGQKLRFDDDHGYEPRRLMRRDLGPNADPLAHNIYTYLQVRNVLFLEGQVDQYEAFLSSFAAGKHDVGENTHPNIVREVGYVVDDVPWGRKSHHSRNVERAVRRFLDQELWAGIPSSILGDAEAVIAHETDRPARDLLSIGHWRAEGSTALRAGNVALIAVRQGEWQQSRRVQQLASLALTVAPRIEAGLLELANQNYWSAAVSMTDYAERARSMRGELQDLIAA